MTILFDFFFLRDDNKNTNYLGKYQVEIFEE